MIIKYCPKCYGKPYTEDFSEITCPTCQSMLQAEMVDEHDLIDRTRLESNRTFQTQEHSFGEYGENNGPDFDCFDDENNRWGGGFTDKNSDCAKTPTTFHREHSVTSFPKDETVPKDDFRNSIENLTTIMGKVAQYSSTGREDGAYRRLFPVKLYQAIVYRQRLEDVLHRFTVRVEQGEDALGYQNYTDVPVNVHGTIAGGLQIVDNAEVEVHGKYKNGVLMADSVYVINNGYKSKVGFQHSVKAITYGVLSAVMLAFIFFVAASSNGSFIANIKEFCTVWLVTAVILTVLYFITSLTKIGLLARIFSNKKRSFPLFGILLISLALAFLFVSAFGSFAGFGSYLSGWAYSLVPIVVIVVALFFIVKSIF